MDAWFIGIAGGTEEGLISCWSGVVVQSQFTTEEDEGERVVQI